MPPGTGPSVDRDGDTRLLEELREDIAHNRLVLPSLPDVARKVREAVRSVPWCSMPGISVRVSRTLRGLLVGQRLPSFGQARVP